MEKLCLIGHTDLILSFAVIHREIKRQISLTIYDYIRVS